MARRRLNAKFVAILGAIVILIGVAGFYVRRVIRRTHPENYQPQAQQAEASHRWKDACDFMLAAVSAAPRDPALRVEYGNDLNEYGKENQDAVSRQQDVEQWTKALEVDPNYVKALRALATYWRTAWQEVPNATTYRNARDWTSKLLAAAPDDADAPEFQSFLQTMTIRASIKGLEPDESLIQTTEAKIKELAAKNPADADLPLCLAELAIHRGQVLTGSSSSGDQPSSATARFNSAADIMAKAVAAQDKSAMMHFNASRIYRMLMNADRSVPPAPPKAAVASAATQPATQPVLSARERYLAAAVRELDRAVELIKPTDEQYATICLDASLFAQNRDDMARSKEIMAGYVREELNDPTMFGRGYAVALLRNMPELRPQVIKALRQAIDAEPKTAEVTLRHYSLLFPLVDLEISDLADAAGESARKSLSDQINPQLQQLESARLGHVDVVKERGRFYMAGGNFLSAVQSLDAAVASDPQCANDADVLWMLARSYMKINELAQARDYCSRVVAIAPESPEPRLQLVQLLAQDGTDEARRQIGLHLSYLNRSMPDDPRVLRLEVWQLDPKVDAEKIKTLYDKLPEKTPDDMDQKARLATTKLPDQDARVKEALRLFSNAVKADPKNVGYALNLANVQLFANRRADAIATIDAALAVNPNDENLQVYLKEASGATPEQMKTLLEKFDQQNPDALDREITMASHAMSAGYADEAAKHIDAALKLSPTSGSALDLQFKLYLTYAARSQAKLDEAIKLSSAEKAKLDINSMTAEARQNWDKLNQIVKKLGDLNDDQANGMIYQFIVAQARQDTQTQINLGVQLTTQMPQFASSYYYLGQAYQAAGNYAQAINSYDTALQKKGISLDSAKWLKAKISCYYGEGHPDEALQAINLGRRQYPADDEFRQRKIAHEVHFDDWASVVADLKEFIGAHQNNPDVQNYLDLVSSEVRLAAQDTQNGNNLQASQADAEADATIADALQRFPDNLAVYQLKSDMLRLAGKIPEAEKALIAATKRPALQKDSEPQRLLGRFYMATGQGDKAETAYNAAMKLAQGDQKAQVQIELAQLFAAEGSGFLRDGKTPEANEKFQEALNVLVSDNTGNKTVLEETVNVLVQKGDIAGAELAIKKIKPANSQEESELETGYAQMELNAAQTDIAGRQAALDATPPDAALAAKDKEQIDAHKRLALQHVTNALEAKPDNPQALFMRAQLVMTQDKPDVEAAMADLNSALRGQPNAVSLLDMRSQLEVLTGHFADSTADLERAVQADPTDFTLRIRLASNYAQYQPVQLDRSLQTLKDGVTVPGGDKNPNLFNNIANVYQQMGRNDQALETISSAMKRIPGNPTLTRSFLRLSLDSQQYQNVVDMASNVIDQVNKGAARADYYWAWQYRGQANARLGQRDTNDKLKQDALSDMIEAFSLAGSVSAKIQVVISMSHDVDADKAIGLVKPMADNDPANWNTMLAILYHQVGKDDDAVRLINQMLAGITPDMPVNLQVMRLELAGSIYATAQPKPFAQLAYDTYKRLIKLEPNDVQALNNFACVCADDFQPPKVADGLENIRRAMQLLADRKTSDAKIGDTYGWLLILGGETAAGVDTIQRAFAGAQKDFPEAHYHLAEGYLRLNNLQNAQAEIRKANEAIKKAEGDNEPVSAQLRAGLADLTRRVFDSQRLGATGGVP